LLHAVKKVQITLTVSRRERPCFVLSAEDKSNRNIETMFLAPKATINVWLGNAAVKIDVHGHMLAVAHALHLELINP
jgi:ATP/maltotriose-dependent transcriptional regulator MalT